MDKCVKCHFYDRKGGRSTDGRAISWGQCRKHSPLLSPLNASNAKSYAIEGVWPTVRDDDWCGEWRALAEHSAERVSDLMTAHSSGNGNGANGNGNPQRPRVTALTTGASAAAGND